MVHKICDEKITRLNFQKFGQLVWKSWALFHLTFYEGQHRKEQLQDTTKNWKNTPHTCSLNSELHPQCWMLNADYDGYLGWIWMSLSPSKKVKHLNFYGVQIYFLIQISFSCIILCIMYDLTFTLHWVTSQTNIVHLLTMGL